MSDKSTDAEDQQTAEDYVVAQREMREAIVRAGEAFAEAATTIHGSGSPLNTGLKLKKAGRALVDIGDAMITWHSALDRKFDAMRNPLSMLRVKGL